MTDFGGKLRQAREGRGISLRQIAASTRISVAALEALERNDISKLPGGIFTRSFVRSYAVEVDLNPDEAVREFVERFGTEPPPEPVVIAHISNEERAFESRRQAAMLTVKVIVVLVVAAAILLFFVVRARRTAAFVPPSAPQIEAGSAQYRGASSGMCRA
ncbi:MAG: helix-turn-helix transcriptional regulator [Vicinamibacterales bacterium]